MEEKDLGLLENGALPRKVMTLFMLIDRSGSMLEYGNIDKVNRAVENTIQTLRDFSSQNFDAEIKIAILSFGDCVRWETGGAVELNEYVWNDLTAKGLTPMGQAFSELDGKLSRSAFLKSSTGAFAPVLMLLSDGQPTDEISFGLEKLSHNNWYRVATKVAIAVNDEATEALRRFTGNPETVIRYDTRKQDLETLITNLAVVSSTMQSRSVNASDLGAAADSGEQLIDTKLADENAKQAVYQVQGEAPVITGGWD